MPHETAPPAASFTFPEQLIMSRHVGDIAAQAFPWLDEESSKPIAVTELVYPEGSIYAASAGSRRLNKITADVRAHDSPSASGYDRLDEFFLRAARLELSSEAINSDRIQLVHTQARDFKDVVLKDYREGGTPNARRIYYGLTNIGKYTVEPTQGNTLDDTALFIVRLGATDKHHQLEFLRQLTGLNHKTLKQKGAGR